MHRRRREGVRGEVEGRMQGHELALEVARQLGDDEAVGGEFALVVVAIALAGRRPLEVDDALVPGGNLQALEALARGPARETLDGVERRLVPRELREEHARSLDRPHRPAPFQPTIARLAVTNARRSSAWSVLAVAKGGFLNGSCPTPTMTSPRTRGRRTVARNGESPLRRGI